MPITKDDVITIKLTPNEVRYCARMANERNPGVEEQPAELIAKELCTYALCKRLFGMTASHWGTWLLRSYLDSKSDLPPSNLVVHSHVVDGTTKMSDYTDTANGSLALVHVIAAAKFSDSDATVYLIGWKSHIATGEIVARDLTPIPPVAWDWTRDNSWHLDKEG